MNVLPSPQRILSLWLDRLPTDRLARSSASHSSSSPAVVYGKRGNAELIVALDAAAERRGLHTGLALAQARAMQPGITAIEEDATADAALLETIADWCLRYTPLVSCDPPDGLLLDIAGCAHLYGGEQRLIEDLALRLRRAGFHFRIAVCGTIGAAYAAARFGAPGLHKSGEEATLIKPLPMAALRIEPGVSAALARLGLKRIGGILDLPRAPLAARFGADLLRQLDRALGREHEPLNPRLPVAPYIAEQRVAEPITREEDVLAVIEYLARQLKSMLERHGDGARKLELSLFRTDGIVRRIVTGTSRPLRDPLEIRALFVERLTALADEYDPGFGFDMARLAVVIAEPCTPEQVGFGNTDDAADLTRLIDHLSARLGGQRVRRLIAHDSHIPELAAATMPAQMKNTDDGWDAFRHYRSDHAIGPRPLRLLPKPEPIKAIAEVPDGPPQRFWWRNAKHEIVAAEGPERIEGNWWSEPDDGELRSVTRDYFRVEDQSGLRFWLFRAGLYRNLSQADRAAGRLPQWFMHGAFA